MPERKALALSLPDDAAPGAVQAVFSTFDVLDKGRDIVKRSAFADLDGAEVPLIWAHDWGSMAVGKGAIRVQPKQAVFDGAFHLQTELSREAYATVKAMGSLQEYSYGFEIAPDGWQFEDASADEIPTRLITKISRVFEVSPVLVGMGEGTRTLAIKGLFEELVDAKAGRRLSAASLARIQAAIEALGALLEADAAVDDGKAAAPPESPPPPPPPAPDPDLATVGERLVADLHAYAARVQASPDPEIRAAKDWVLSATRRLAETRRTLDDRLRLAEEAGDMSALELEQQFRALDARIGLVLGGGTACRR